MRWNIPISINEAHLKECFEPSEYGMRLVKSVKLFRGRPAALVEFIDESAVGNVLSRATIIYRNIEFHFTPFKPLLAPNEKISEVNIQGSCLLHVGDFTEFVLEKQLEHLVPPPCGIEPTAIMQVGSRVLRGRDWIYGNQDGEGLGTVTHFFFIPFGAPYTHNVSVQWDNGNWYSYRMSGGFYELKLAPTAQ